MRIVPIEAGGVDKIFNILLVALYCESYYNCCQLFN
jgi:hypothetical protein